MKFRWAAKKVNVRLMKLCWATEKVNARLMKLCWATEKVNARLMKLRVPRGGRRDRGDRYPDQRILLRYW